MIGTILRLPLRRCGALVCAIAFILFCAIHIEAQSVTFDESVMPPNNTFSTAQNVGALPPLAGSRITVTGSREGGDDSADFFSFELTSGRTITLATNPLPGDDPFAVDTILGLFDPDGNLVAFNDDGDGGFTSFLSFTVPDGINGFFRAAVSGYGDSGTFDANGVQLSSMFTGGGSADYAYRLVIEGQNAAPDIAAIPEPSTLLLLAISIAGVGAAVAKRGRGKACG